MCWLLSRISLPCGALPAWGHLLSIGALPTYLGVVGRTIGSVPSPSGQAQCTERPKGSMAKPLMARWVDVQKDDV